MTASVVFYEKPGCLSNRRQKSLLSGLGHRLEVRDLLREVWTPERLRLFFGERPLGEWFNPTAPRVKSGELLPEMLDEARALELMVRDPILIRRPLMALESEQGVLRCCGFEPGPLLDRLGLDLDTGQDLQSCSKSGTHVRCGPSEGA